MSLTQLQKEIKDAIDSCGLLERCGLCKHCVFIRYCQTWIANGEAFKYPPCCIGAFLTWDKPSENRRKAAKEGFVPCERHALMILSGKLTVEKLLGRELIKTC